MKKTFQRKLIIMLNANGKRTKCDLKPNTRMSEAYPVVTLVPFNKKNYVHFYDYEFVLIPYF